MRLFWILPFSLLIGCNGPGDSGKDTSETEDSGTETSQVDPYKDLPAGCITVNEAGDYPDLASAVTWAPDGGAIAICAGSYTASVTIDKTLTITGAGADQTIIDADTNLSVFDISADEVTISAMTLTSARSAVTLDGAQNTTFAGITFDQPQNWGIESQDATFTVSGSTFTAPVFGGISVNGGSATVTQSTFTDAERYGVSGVDADLSVIGSTFTTVYSSGDTGVNDGIAVYAQGGTITSSDNVMSTPALAGLFGDDASVTSTDDLVTDTTYGIIGIGPDVAVSTIEVQNALISGLFLIADNSVTVTGALLNTDPTLSYSLTYDEFWTYANKGSYIGGGILAAGPTVSISDTTITNWNNFGLVVLPTSSSDPVALTIDGLAITDVSRMGAYLSSVEGTISNSSITGMIEPELTEPCTHPVDGLRLDISFGMFAASSDLAFDNVTFADNAGWGLSNYSSQAAFTNSALGAHECASILDFTGALTLTDSTVTGGWVNGAIWEYQGVLNVDRTTFTDFSDSYTYTSVVAGKTIEQITPGSGYGIYAYGTDAVTVANSTFNGGDTAMYFYEAGGEITGNTITGTTRSGINASTSTIGQNELVISGNTFDAWGGYLAYGYYTTITAKDNVVGTQDNYVYSYSEYIDGELNYEYSYESAQPLFMGYYGTVEVDGLTADSLTSHIVNSYEGTVSMRNVDVGAAAGAVLSGSWYSTAPDVEIADVTLDSATYYGLYLYNSSSNLESGFLDVSDVTIGSTTYDGVYLYGAFDATFDGLSVLDAGTAGLTATDVTNLAIYGSDLESGGSDGIYVSGGTVTIEDSVATSNGDNGVELQSTTATVQNNSFTANTSYGMLCASTTLTACLENDLSGNGFGEHSGCDDACGIASAE